MSTEAALTPFQKWYNSGGKEKLAKRRKERYANDPEYRDRCLKASASSRQEKRRELAHVPATHTLTHSEVADRIGVTQATMRTWRMREYYPEPFVAENGRLYFTESQVSLLQSLADFFNEKTRRRLNPQDKKRLHDIRDSIYVNWA